MEHTAREKKIYRVTLQGSLVNTLLMIGKFVGGIMGNSAAMLADAVHSLSDFLTDIVVLVFVKISAKPKDEDHCYGHGKYETLATILIGIALFVVGAVILATGTQKIVAFCRGETLTTPGIIALIAALVSIILKEWTYRFTAKVGKEVNSQTVVANAWHHRSDALSSIGTAVGIGGAIFLGERWAVLDPIAAVIVSLFIFRTAASLIQNAFGDLMEKSLPKEVEEEIRQLVESNPYVSEMHNLCTRKVGNNYAIEMHVRMPANMPLFESHLHATEIEQVLRQHYGPHTHINLHVEPLKVSSLNPSSSK